MKKVGFALILMILATAISNILGLARELVLAYKYGTSSIADVYVISTNLPITVFSIFVAAIVTSYVPISSKYAANVKSLNEFTSKLLNIVLLVTIILFSLFFYFTEEIVKVFAYGFTEENLVISISLTRTMFWGIFPMAIYMVLQHYLNLKQKFIGTAFIGAILNSSWIIGILLSSEENLKGLSIGNVCGYILVAVYIVGLSYKNGYKYRFVLDFKDSQIKKVILMSIPIFLSLLVTQLNGIVDRAIASAEGVGAIAILNYSSRLMYVVYGLLIVTFITFINPKISKLYNENILRFNKNLPNLILLLLIILMPLVLSVFIFAEFFITVLFDRGAFTEEDLVYTSLCLKLYILSIIPLGIRELLNRVFFIYENSRTPLLNNILFVGGNIILSIIFVKCLNFNFVILSLTTTLANVLALLLYLIEAKYKGVLIINRGNFFAFIKIVVINIVVYLIVLLEVKWFGLEKGNYTFFLTWCLYFLQYAIAIYYTKLKKYFNALFI